MSNSEGSFSPSESPSLGRIRGRELDDEVLRSLGIPADPAKLLELAPNSEQSFGRSSPLLAHLLRYECFSLILSMSLAHMRILQFPP